MGQKIKYMGSEDARILEKGENWSGRLAEPLTKEVRWDWDNDHVIDTDEVALSPEAVELLLTDDGFKDVTDMKRIPANAAQKMWKGTKDPTPNVVEEDGTADPDTKGEQGSDTGGGGTTTGGSTASTTATGGRTTSRGSTRGS